jgi:hypothetical protein
MKLKPLKSTVFILHLLGVTNSIHSKACFFLALGNEILSSRKDAILVVSKKRKKYHICKQLSRFTFK